MSAPFVFESPIAAVLVFGPLVGSVLLENRRFHGDVWRRGRDRTYRRLQAWQIAGLVLGVLAAKNVSHGALGGGEWLWPVLGCLVGCAGVALRLWAIHTLGPLFTRHLQVGADHSLVIEGPYRLLRHPSYTGAILMFAGIGLGLGNALSVAACLALPAIGYIERISREELLLQQKFGEPYIEYAGQTKRLVPGVW